QLLRLKKYQFRTLATQNAMAELNGRRQAIGDLPSSFPDISSINRQNILSRLRTAMKAAASSRSAVNAFTIA
ncbi:hypothetical protein PT277_03455, partial [Acetobacteraceae bacterium ESL0709]|nr:hypothetical protein [Acetobacteraceae bacterium ESL0709]